MRGVELDDGERIAAASVISTADARSTFEQLLPAEALPARFMRRLRAMEVTICSDALYVGTDLDPRSFGARHENIVSTNGTTSGPSRWAWMAGCRPRSSPSRR